MPMNNKERVEQEVQEYVDEAQEVLKLQALRVYITVDEAPNEDFKRASTDSSGQPVARMLVDQTYQRGHLEVDLNAFLLLPPHIRKACIFHEVAHLFTDRLVNVAGRLIEGKLVTVHELETEAESLTEQVSRLALELSTYGHS